MWCEVKDSAYEDHGDNCCVSKDMLDERADRSFGSLTTRLEDRGGANLHLPSSRATRAGGSRVALLVLGSDCTKSEVWG